MIDFLRWDPARPLEDRITAVLDAAHEEGTRGLTEDSLTAAILMCNHTAIHMASVRLILQGKVKAHFVGTEGQEDKLDLYHLGLTS